LIFDYRREYMVSWEAFAIKAKCTELWACLGHICSCSLMSGAGRVRDWGSSVLGWVIVGGLAEQKDDALHENKLQTGRYSYSLSRAHPAYVHTPPKYSLSLLHHFQKL
jgi:hypothetical protein